VICFFKRTGVSIAYNDDWIDDDGFIYTDEGRKGNMFFTKGNLAIRDHPALGKKILVFIYERKATGYRSPFT